MGPVGVLGLSPRLVQRGGCQRGGCCNPSHRMRLHWPRRGEERKEFGGSCAGAKAEDTVGVEVEQGPAWYVAPCGRYMVAVAMAHTHVRWDYVAAALIHACERFSILSLFPPPLRLSCLSCCWAWVYCVLCRSAIAGWSVGFADQGLVKTGVRMVKKGGGGKRGAPIVDAQTAHELAEQLQQADTQLPLASVLRLLGASEVSNQMVLWNFHNS